MQTSTEESLSLLALGRFLIGRYPARTLKVVVLLFLAGLAEGIGVLSILPLLGLARGTDPSGLDETSRALLDIVRSVGLDPSLAILLGIIVVGTTIKAGLMVLAGREAGYATSDMGTDLRLSLIRGLMKARWDHFTSQLVGRHANAVGSEALRASAVFENVTRMVANTFQVLLYAAVALVVAPIVTLGSLVFGLAIFWSLRFLIRMAREAGRRQTGLLQTLTVRLTESLSAIKPLKAMAREKAFQPLLEKDIRDLNEAQRRLVLSNALLPSVQEPLTVLILAAGAFVYLTQLRVGLEQFIFMAFLFYRTVVRVGNLQVAYQKLAGPESALAALRVAIASAHEAVEHNTGTREPALKIAITVEGLSLSYGPKVVFTGFSASIPARRITAVIGPSGVGKTSLADLIVGLVRPNAGRVLLDGTPLDEIDIKRWRSMIGYVPQETFLFHDSVFVNVALNDPDITTGEVERALRLAQAWDFVSGLEDGINSIVGERGSKLSGGQRQRIAFARALVNKPELLILDEATAALDPITEKAIWQMVRGFTEHCTVLAISHQTALMDVADVVIKLDSAEFARHQAGAG